MTAVPDESSPHSSGSPPALLAEATLRVELALALLQAAARDRVPRAARHLLAARRLRAGLVVHVLAARAALTNAPAEVWTPSFTGVAGTILGEGGLSGLDAVAAGIPDTAAPAFWAGAADGALDGGNGPQEAATAFARLPADCEDRIDLADRITKEWLRRNEPEAASRWVQSLPRDMARDFAAAALAEGLILTDPDAAAQWAADIQSERIRGDVRKRLAK